MVNEIRTIEDRKKALIKKGSENRTSFKEIIKEFVTDETNKINAINDSES